MKRFEMPESMKLASIWVVWVFLAIGALGSALFVVLEFFGMKEQAAAWVQAIGSVAAIGAAIWISDRSHRLDRLRDEHAQLVEQVRLAWLAECAIYEAVEAIGAVVDIGLYSVVHKKTGLPRVGQAGETVRTLLLQPIPHRLVHALFRANAAIAEAFAILDGAYTSDDWGGLVNSLRRQQSTLLASRFTVEQEYHRLAVQAGVPFTQRVLPH